MKAGKERGRERERESRRHTHKTRATLTVRPFVGVSVGRLLACLLAAAGLAGAGRFVQQTVNSNSDLAAHHEYYCRMRVKRPSVRGALSYNESVSDFHHTHTLSLSLSLSLSTLILLYAAVICPPRTEDGLQSQAVTFL